MATTYKTSNEGAFTFSGKSYKIAGDSSVIFQLDDEGNVTAVNNLEGTITADFENGISINGYPIQITGDNNNSVSVTADSGGISNIAGVNGDEVYISNFGNADSITATSGGTFTIGSTTFIVDDKNGVTFLLSEGAISGVEDLSGSVTGDFSSGLTVNGTLIKITGGVVTATYANDSISVSVDSGTFNIGNRSFTVDGVNSYFEFDSEGSVTGVNNLIGSITFKSDGLPFSVNGNSLTIGVNDEVTIYTDSSGNITGIANFSTYITGLPANATVGATDKNITVNGTAISINEGADTKYILALNGAGVPTQASALSDGVTINNVPANMQLVTEENGAFRIGGRTYTVSGNDSGVTFSTDDSGKVTAVDNLNGAIYVQGDVTLNVNGFAVAVDKAVSAGDTISIYAGSNGIYNIYGLNGGDSLNGDLIGAAVSMPAESSLFINERNFSLSNDSDGVIIIPNSSYTSIKYLSAGSSIAVDSAGTYIVTNDDDEAFTLSFADSGTIFADSDSFISAYNPDDFLLDSDLDSIINKIASLPSNYINLKSPLTSFDSDINYNLNLVFYLNNTSDSPASYDFSGTSFRKRVSLVGGVQSLTLNDEPDNIVVVTSSAYGDKDIFLGDGGNNVVIEHNNANVSVHAGKGSDFIVAKSDASIFTNNDSQSKFAPLNSSSISLFNYGIEEFYSGAGVQTSVGKVLNAIKSGTISFSDSYASIKGAGSVHFYSDSATAAVFANFYDKYSNPAKVAFSNGGTLDASFCSDSLIICGNFSQSPYRSSSIFGGSSGDSKLAGDSDSICCQRQYFIELPYTL